MQIVGISGSQQTIVQTVVQKMSLVELGRAAVLAINNAWAICSVAITTVEYQEEMILGVVEHHGIDQVVSYHDIVD